MTEPPLMRSRRTASHSIAMHRGSHDRAVRHGGRRLATPIAIAFLFVVVTVAAVPVVVAQEGGGSGWTLLGWNDLDMHCMDADYSIFSIRPPYNTIHAQLIDPSGELVTDPSGIIVTYEAVADPEGSINVSSINKTNFWDWVTQLFGASPAPDQGLAGSDMPGPINTPQPMHFDSTFVWFTGEGIPITPYDDAGAKNFYPVMRLVARDASGEMLATTRVVLPVSDEMTCRSCHDANALPGTGMAGIPPLTQAVHSLHANVIDPSNGMTLNESANRAACYTCHPGTQTRCLRGAMGNAVAADGDLAIQCQSCHGSMNRVGAAGREGWFEQPNCQGCHSGTATDNSGQIRFLSVFDESGEPRAAVNPDTPAPGVSLYRFSTGHGDLQCAACHGSTHAIYPSSHLNDNLQNIDQQGHAGALVDCDGCHSSRPRTVTGGPHGMHPVGEGWVDRHEDAAEENDGQCRACHGTDHRGTVLSRALGGRVVDTESGTKSFWQSFQIGCYTCHNGPNDEHRNRNRAPVVHHDMASTNRDVPVG